MTWTQFLTFLVFSIAFYATPGPATLSLAAAGAAFGFRRSVPYVLGICTGLFFNLVVVAFGLGYLFQFPVVYQIFKYVSLIYIFYLAWQIANSSIETQEARSFGFLQGVLLNLLNPKAYIAAVAVMTQFGGKGSDFWESMVFIIITLTILVTIIDFLWCYLGEMLGKLFSSSEKARLLNRIMAVLLVASVLFATFFS